MSLQLISSKIGLPEVTLEKGLHSPQNVGSYHKNCIYDLIWMKNWLSINNYMCVIVSNKCINCQQNPFRQTLTTTKIPGFLLWKKKKRYLGYFKVKHWQFPWNTFDLHCNHGWKIKKQEIHTQKEFLCYIHLHNFTYINY